MTPNVFRKLSLLHASLVRLRYSKVVTREHERLTDETREIYTRLIDRVTLPGKWVKASDGVFLVDRQLDGGVLCTKPRSRYIAFKNILAVEG